MTTISDLVGEIDRELLQHYTAPQLDLPSGSISTSTTSISLSTVDSLSPGSVIDIGFELMYVTSWQEGNRTATVIRGLYGSGAASHAVTDLVRVNPRITTVAMLDAMRDEIRSWDEQVFDVEADVVSFGSEDGGVNIAPTRDPYRILSARPRPNSGTTYKTMTLSLRYDENASVFAGGYSVHLPPGLLLGQAATVDVLYAVPFATTTLATSTDLQTTVGLSDSMLEIVKWGALSRLIAGKQEGRLHPFGTMRSDIEQGNPAMSFLQTSAEYMRLRDKAYARESLRLLAKYPYRAENS